MKSRKRCHARNCVFWRKVVFQGGECLCEDGSEACPYGRAGTEGCMLTGDEKEVS